MEPKYCEYCGEVLADDNKGEYCDDDCKALGEAEKEAELETDEEDEDE